MGDQMRVPGVEPNAVILNEERPFLAGSRQSEQKIDPVLGDVPTVLLQDVLADFELLPELLDPLLLNLHEARLQLTPACQVEFTKALLNNSGLDFGSLFPVPARLNGCTGRFSSANQDVCSPSISERRQPTPPDPEPRSRS
jgi:hypothetical protein